MCFGLLAVPVSAQRPAVDSLDQAVLDLFPDYPDNHNLQVIVYSHARREPMEKSRVAFYSTWFLHGNPRVTMATIVNNDGQVFTYPLPNSEIHRTQPMETATPTSISRCSWQLSELFLRLRQASHPPIS